MASHFPDASFKDWNSWKWQLSHRVKNFDEFQRIFDLSPDLKETFLKASEGFPPALTPYYAALSQFNENLKKTVIPGFEELREDLFETLDPLEDKKYSPVTGLIHKYPNRVLLLMGTNCAVFCRYCTRKEFIRENKEILKPSFWKSVKNHLTQNPLIDEIILSGGDPLFMEDRILKGLMEKIESLEQIKIIRISSKIPVVLPQRITRSLLKTLKTRIPLYLNIHINHPAELSSDFKKAAEDLVRAGVVLSSQTVLLKGVNDDIKHLLPLMKGLLQSKIRPYALFQCDLAPGTAHFRTPVKKGLELLREIQAELGGMASPHFIADPKGGKVILAPQNIIRDNDQGVFLKSGKGTEVFYPN
ncbi:MAG: KamA family radical SAM protein [Deltaproteobacteria bacterium]|nr:KamA family radical SAM protein [Deltaproteobacteria bacterium]